ncbi:acyl-CoA N-acyltransferase [Chaetomium fimeti]|uniref:Acyl-CoA N-acyltransferase n=1 Tax=Chaetomium fimeti TaxID=1854472 RepID=A0AAE0LNJ0_9PEZI|nr:acyl-CoA N-acyltransferase [Chaetomium fimeti]
MPDTDLVLHFRVATADDLPLIHPLVESAYRGDESRLGWTTEADLISGTRIDKAGLLAKITDPAGAVLLATTTTTTTTTTTNETNAPTNEELIACCEVSQRDDDAAQTAHFGMFAVSPRRQGGGVGRRVLAHAEAYCARAWGAARLEMTVIASRAELLAWYARRGYRPTGAHRPFPADELARLGGVALVGDLRFLVLEKELGVVG